MSEEVPKDSKSSTRESSPVQIELEEISVASEEKNESKSVHSIGQASLMFNNLGFDNGSKSDDSTEEKPEINISKQKQFTYAGAAKFGLDRILKRDERDFYLYNPTDEGEEGPQIVAGEKINNLEVRFVTIPELFSHAVDKHQLQRLTNSYWKPVHKKIERINQFLRNLILTGDIELMQKAFSQFSILESLYSSPFSRDRKRPPDRDSLLHICARFGTRDTMDKLLNAKSPTFPLDLRSDRMARCDSILHAAVYAENYETTKSILDFIPGPSDEAKNWLTPAIGKRTFTFSNTSRDSKDEPSSCGKDLLNLLNEKKDSALHIALKKTDYEMFEILLENSADISVQDRYGNNILHIATAANDNTALEMIIRNQQARGELGTTKLKDVLSTINKKDKKPTELATNQATMEMLLSCYCDDGEKRNQLGMLLSSATERNKLDLATFLVSKGASLDFESDQGVTALKLASKRGYTDLVTYILKEGNDPNQTSRNSTQTAINNASKAGHMELVKLLIKYNASLWDEQSMQTSALHSAVNGGQLHIISFLVKEKGMDPNTKDSDGNTPLYYAVKGGYKDCVKALLNCRADPELPVEASGDKAVHLAAKRNDRNILKVLLEYGARSDDKNMEGKTPIDIALLNDYPHILDVLLEYKVGFDREDEENNTPMHVIATNGSYQCADFLLRDAEVEMAFRQLKAENVDGETPIGIAKMKGNDAVLITFIEKVPMDYFDEKAKIYHQFLEEEQFDILKTIFNRMCEETNGGREVHCRALMLDTNGKGQSPFSQNFSHLLPSLLHKLVECDDKELREHPIVKKTVEKKLNFYRLWYVLSFLIYLVFVVVFSTALYLASYECDSDLRLIELNELGSSYRLVCETFSWVFVGLLTISEFIEFAYGWSRIIKINRLKLMEAREMRESIKSKDIEKGGIVKDQTNCFIMVLEWGKKLKDIFPFLNRTFCYLPQGILQYIYDSPTDLLGIVSFFLYFAIRFDNPNVSWLFASLSFIGFIISLLKYTRVIPSLGAYIATVKAVFSKDIPRFLVLYVIVLVAFIGGIHLAARFQPLGDRMRMRFEPNGHENPDMCQNDSSQLFFFDDDLTQNYTLLAPFVAGLILLLDGGPGNRDENILNTNIYFAVIYILFSFTIIVVLSNILIAQLSETYAALSAQGTFYYRMGLVVTMELESTLAFFLGKYFRQLSSIKSFNMPIDEWKDLINESPDENINKQLSHLVLKINKYSAGVNEGNEKLTSQREVLDKLGEQVAEILGKVDFLQMDMASTIPIGDSLPGAAKGKFAPVSIDERMEHVESTMEQIAMHSMGLENKLNDIISLLKSK